MNNIADIQERIVDAVVGIFTDMIMMEVEHTAEGIESTGVFTDSITGVVGLAGTKKGCLGIHFPNAVAIAITSSFLGMDVEGINEDVEDAIGEVANMLGGELKMILSDKGKDIQLSLPSTIAGKEYTYVTQSAGHRLNIPFKTPSGAFVVEIELED